VYSVSLIGSGLIAKKKHIPAWQRLKGEARLASIVETNTELGRQAAAEFGIPKVYTDLSEMLAEERPDIVDICTPPRSHAPIAEQCLNAGAHVMVEKPMAVDASECDRMIAAAKAANKQICVVHSDLFYPSFMKARELVNQGRIGEFRGMRILLITPYDYIVSKSDHWANKLPGGIIGETGPHMVYMTLAFIDKIVGVHAVGKKLLPEYPWSLYEDYRVDLIGEKATSSTVLLFSNNQWAAQVDLFGSKGMIQMDIESQVVTVYDRPNLKAQTIGRSACSAVTQTLGSVAKMTSQILTKRFQSTHEQIVAQFCASLKAGGKSPVPAEQGREAVRVMDIIAHQLQNPPT
jgi:predicted dehydrogenase